jgi:hydroxymethylpyrimidine/phosphomethylpyrimidine kinase
VVVDPVMVATSGARLLQPAAVRSLTRDLFPLATLLTPNLDEAALLLGAALFSVEDLRAAARTLQGRFGCAVLVKGGHLRGLREAVDVFWDGATELLLTAPYVRGVGTHGTGCTYAAAIAGGLAGGLPLQQAVGRAKEYVTQAIAGSQRIGRHWTLGVPEFVGDRPLQTR